MTDVQLGKQTVHLAGKFVSAGDTAPDFNLVNTRLKNQNWKNFSDKPCVIYCVPSLDTEGCANSTRKIEQLARDIPGYQVLVISADLPFAIQRFVTEHEIKHIQCLSTFRDSRFAKHYGLLMENGPLAGLLARAVIITDKQHQVRYSQLVNNIGDEPDYESLLQNTN